MSGAAEFMAKAAASRRIPKLFLAPDNLEPG
jgi:hypothetical protein